MAQTPENASEDSVLAAIAEAVPAARFETVTPSNGPIQDVVLVEAADYLVLATTAHDLGFDTFIDLCAVDYLRRDPRFEVVVVLLSHSLKRRLRIRVGVPASDSSVATLTDLFAGANFYEREAFDLFGIHFDGHPDLTRILMPDDWEGHPLRKDASVGSVPVQFKKAHQAK